MMNVSTSEWNWRPMAKNTETQQMIADSRSVLMLINYDSTSSLCNTVRHILCFFLARWWYHTANTNAPKKLLPISAITWSSASIVITFFEETESCVQRWNGSVSASGMFPGRRLRTPYTIVYDRAQPNTLRMTVELLRSTWLSMTIVILRVVYGRSWLYTIHYWGANWSFWIVCNDVKTVLFAFIRKWSYLSVNDTENYDRNTEPGIT